ncbi:MAG: sugar ABC transporter substrate-binding protein [Pleomorphochaeta sp.]
MKKSFILLTLILILGMTNIFANGSSEQAEDGQIVFGFTCMDQTNPFQVTMKNSIESAVEANGDKLIAIDGMNDQIKQNNAIDDMITRGISVLFLNPVDKDGVKPALEACKEAGVKVIAVDANVTDTDLTESFISSNNVQAGRLCGEAMKEAFPNGARVALIDNPLAESVVSRMTGLQQALEGSNIEITGLAHYSSMNTVLSTFEDFLQADSDLDAFWGLNDEFGLIAEGVVQSAGRTGDIKVFSVDGSPSAKISIKEGGLYATAAQSPAGIGQKAVEVAYSLLNGQSVEKNYSIETILVDQNNIDQFDTSVWL